jgi:hypothetical protein
MERIALMGNKIKVTDLETGIESIYDYSKNNWRRVPACMQNGLVIMWVPTEARHGVVIRTSGRRWEVLGDQIC